MQPTVFYRKNVGSCIVTQEKKKSYPETIRARTRDACPGILAARLREAFTLSRMIIESSILEDCITTTSLTFAIMIDLRSIYDSSISPSDARPNSVKKLVFWPDDKPEPDGEAYAQPESDLQMRVRTSTSGAKRVSRRALVRPLTPVGNTKRTRMV
jgi:hypothetical protein